MNSIRKYELMLKRAMDNQAFESYDDYETYDGFDDFEDFENYRRYAMAARRRGASRNFGMPKVRMNRPVMYRPGATPAASSLAAQFDIKIERKIKTGGSIAYDLPVMLFMPLQAISTNYSDVVIPPTGVTLNVKDSADGSYTFEYDDGTNTNQLVVSCLQVPLRTLYTAFLNAEMDVFKMRFTAPTSTYSQFFAQPLGTYRKSLLGKVSDVDTIPFISQKSPGDYAQHILDVDVAIHLQNDKGLTYKMPQVNDSITISFFINNLIIK